MQARIFKPSKTAMQSGKAKTDRWVLEFEAEEKRGIDPLMGYTTSSDMRSQLRLEFDTLEDAKAYATRKGIAFSVHQPHKARRRAMSYADNFSYHRALPWTH